MPAAKLTVSEPIEVYPFVPSVYPGDTWQREVELRSIINAEPLDLSHWTFAATLAGVPGTVNATDAARGRLVVRFEPDATERARKGTELLLRGTHADGGVRTFARGIVGGLAGSSVALGDGQKRVLRSDLLLEVRAGARGDAGAPGSVTPEYLAIADSTLRARDEARDSAATAGDRVEEVAAHARDADSSARSAAGSASSASSSAASAGTARNAADQAAGLAGTRATAAAGSATAAGASATESTSSASKAAGSATTATDSAAEALRHARAAQAAADLAVPVVNLGDVSGVLDLRAYPVGGIFAARLVGDITGITLPEPIATQQVFELLLSQDASSTPRVITWPATFRSAFGLDVTLSTTPASLDRVAVIQSVLGIEHRLIAQALA